MKTLTAALRPWTIRFHVAQNDATVKGSGTHDKTGHHCLPNIQMGSSALPTTREDWLHGPDGKLTKAIRHICWDGCMFPNAVMMKQETWNDILRSMIAVRDAHGWREEEQGVETEKSSTPSSISRNGDVNGKPRKKKPVARKPRKSPKLRAVFKKPLKKSAPEKTKEACSKKAKTGSRKENKN